jgi:hypothetical protein
MVILAPSLAYDVVRAHLPLVHVYASQHALYTPSYLTYGFFPQAVEMLMTLGYTLGGDPAAQMLPPVYFALALLMVFRIGRICGLGPFPALAGMVFAGTMPFLHWTGSVAKNDLAFAFFVLAALYGYLRWRESADFRWILLGAFFLAMAAGVKDAIVLAAPPLIWLFISAARREPSPVRAIASVAFILLLFGGFWHIRTLLLTGHLVYPLPVGMALSVRGVSRGWWSVVARCAAVPWEFLFQGRRFFESPLDYPMGIFLTLFVPLWALSRRKINRLEITCLGFSGAYMLYWALVIGRSRFAIAPLSIVCVLTAGAMAHFYRTASRTVKISIVAASAYALLFALLASAIVEINAPQLLYFAGRIDKAGYLRRAMLPYRTLEFLHKDAHSGDAVFSAGNCAVAYAPDPSGFDCILESPRLGDIVKTAMAERKYRYLILPAGHSHLAPPDWPAVYADESFQVYRRDP